MDGLLLGARIVVQDAYRKQGGDRTNHADHKRNGARLYCLNPRLGKPLGFKFAVTKPTVSPAAVISVFITSM